MNPTICDTPAPAAAVASTGQGGSRRRPWAVLAAQARAAAGAATAATAAGESRAYFRCEPLRATISVEQCRTNRSRLPLEEALAIPFDLPPWWVQPLACTSCTLAPEVEAGRVPLFSAEEVLGGLARAAGAGSRVESGPVH